MKINGKEREPYILCHDCGFGVKRSRMFVKAYRHTAICLCKKCAKKLAEEINEKYMESEKDNDKKQVF